MLRKREHIISLVKKRSVRYLKHNENVGIKNPHNAIKAKGFDDENGNTYWMNAIAKEMVNVWVIICILEDGEVVPHDHQFVRCHVIYDLKLEDFWCRARFVAGGNMTDAPPIITYATVIT